MTSRSLRPESSGKMSARWLAAQVLRWVVAGLDRDRKSVLWNCVSWHEVIDWRVARLMEEAIRELDLGGSQAEALAYLLVADCLPPHDGNVLRRRDAWASSLRALSRALRNHRSLAALCRALRARR